MKYILNPFDSSAGKIGEENLTVSASAIAWFSDDTNGFRTTTTQRLVRNGPRQHVPTRTAARSR